MSSGTAKIQHVRSVLCRATQEEKHAFRILGTVFHLLITFKPTSALDVFKSPYSIEFIDAQRFPTWWETRLTDVPLKLTPQAEVAIVTTLYELFAAMGAQRPAV